MRWLFTFAAISATFLTAGCATGPKQISYEEASAFEKRLIATELPAKEIKYAGGESEKIYVQPVNKKEPCKIVSSQEQIERKNFKAFWDGDCKDGYADGLGRDIAISDSHHYEEISYVDHAQSGKLSAAYDFINNRFVYGKLDEQARSFSGVLETIWDDEYKFNVEIDYVKFFTTEKYLFKTSPFYPGFKFHKVTGRLAYVIEDFAEIPGKISKLVAVRDLSTNTNGVAVLVYKNGTILHRVLNPRGIPEMVSLPPEYLQHLANNVKDMNTVKADAMANAGEAKAIERQYLAKFCDSRYRISGLEDTKARMICTWRDRFSDKFEKRKAKVQAELKDRAVQVAEQERVEQERLRQEIAARGQAMRELTAALQGFGQALQPNPGFMQYAPSMPAVTPNFGMQNNNNMQHFYNIRTGQFTNCVNSSSGSVMGCQ